LLKTAALLYATTLKLASDLMDVSKLAINAFTLVVNMPLAMTTQIGAILLDLIIRPNY
jgi:hypothetical protein